MKRKNVLVVTHNTFQNRGSILDSVGLMEEELNKRGIKTVYLLTPECKSLKFSGELSCVYFQKSNPILNLIEIIKIINRESISIIHTHLVFPKQILIIKIASKLTGTTFVRHMHMLYKKINNPIKNTLKKLLGTGDINIACSKACEQTLLLANVKNVVTITNAIDFKKLTIKIKTGSTDKTNILMFGYDYENKGVGLAIRAIKQILDMSIRLQICVTVGVEKIKDKIREEFSEIPSFIQFLPATDNISEYYNNCDIFLSSGSIESYCFAAREATYCGVKVIASNIPAHVMNCGEWLFKSDDWEDLARVIKECAIADFSPEDNRRGVVQSNSEDKWVHEIMKVYTEIWQKRGVL